MSLPPASYDQLERAFAAWAQARADVRAAVVVGSRARVDPPPDEWSDLDLIVFTIDMAGYAADNGWLAQFGTPAITAITYSQRGDAEWIIVFENGLKLDVLLAPIDPLGPINTAPYDIVLRYGVRVLFDKSAPELKRALEREPMPAGLPAPDAFRDAVHAFALDALRGAKFTRRGDLWRAHDTIDGALKRQLLAMLEWHALALDPARRVWHEGRFIAQWVDRRAAAALPALFARYDPIDLRRALFATLELYQWTAAETAQRLGLIDPGRILQRTAEWLAAIFRE